MTLYISLWLPPLPTHPPLRFTPEVYNIRQSIVRLEKIEIIRSQEFMPSEARQTFLKKMIILGPKKGTNSGRVH